MLLELPTNIITARSRYIQSSVNESMLLVIYLFLLSGLKFVTIVPVISVIMELVLPTTRQTLFLYWHISILRLLLLFGVFYCHSAGKVTCSGGFRNFPDMSFICSKIKGDLWHCSARVHTAINMHHHKISCQCHGWHLPMACLFSLDRLDWRCLQLYLLKHLNGWRSNVFDYNLNGNFNWMLKQYCHFTPWNFVCMQKQRYKTYSSLIKS